jgi:hypothetical protein
LGKDRAIFSATVDMEKLPGRLSQGAERQRKPKNHWNFTNHTADVQAAGENKS